jgi:hypothetical protein
MQIFPLPPSGPRRLNFTIREITSGWDRRRFVRFAARLYRGDRYWAPGVLSERTRALDPGKNPSLAHIRLGLFMAESRTLDETVGTIAVWFDSRGAAGPHRRTGCFGLFEFINEGEVVSGLLETAETWLREHLPEAGGLRGPMELDPCRSPGLLVDAYNTKPAVLMPYNPPYYAELIEQAGYAPGSELLAYRLDLTALRDPSSPETIRLQAEAQPTGAYRDLIVREVGGATDWRAFLSQAEQGSPDTAWRLGPESPAMPFPEVLCYLKRFAGRRPLPIILATHAGRDGDAVAFGVAAPNLREPAIAAFGKRLTNGRLSGRRRSASPGFATRRAGRAGIRLLPAILRTDCPGMGLEEPILAGLLMRAAKQGYATAEISPVPTGDLPERDGLAALGASPYKTYAIYEKRF